MKFVRAAGNGSCLFVALRLGLECTAVNALAERSMPVRSACLDGFDARILSSSEDLRGMLLKWYAVDKPVPSLGNFVEATTGSEAVQATETSPAVAAVAPTAATLWSRWDIIITELSRTGKFTSTLSREQMVQRYLRTMSTPGIWGSTPEYMAFAFMSKLNVEVYQPKRGSRELMCVNIATVPEPKGTVKLLFNGANHYDLLLDDDVALRMAGLIPGACILDYNDGAE